MDKWKERIDAILIKPLLDELLKKITEGEKLKATK